MNEKKIVILGVGHSGLTPAHALLDLGYTIDDIAVIEQHNIAVVLSRSEIVDGAPIDIGGGHFLDAK